MSLELGTTRAAKVQIGASARAFAPAGVGNVAVGFDLLGMALDTFDHDGHELGDIVTATVTNLGQVRVSGITGLALDLPLDAEHNTAARAVRALLRALDLQIGFELHIHKGIPLGSGLGGSAASAVAGVVAANAALGSPFELEALYPFALEGECAASGARHGDNVGPQLLGGLCFTNSDRCISLPVPSGLTAVVVHPDFVLETKIARAALAVPFQISEFVAQSDKLAGFLIALYENDHSLLRQSLADVLVEPKRAPLIPGFYAVKQAALDAGAIGASILGYAFGPRYARRAAYNVTSGDVSVAFTGALLGGVAASSLIGDGGNDTPKYGVAAAGVLAGAFLADRGLVRRADRTSADGTLVQLGALAGALIGGGIAALTETETRGVLALGSAGGILGLLAANAIIKPARDAGPLRGIMQSSARALDGRVFVSLGPVTSVRVTF